MILKTKVKGNLTATLWKDRHNVNIQRSLHSPPMEDHFCDERGKAIKPAIIQDCNRYTGYVAKSDCITNCYSISRWTWQWTKKLFFQLMDLTTVKSFIILTSWGSKLTHLQFRLTLVRVAHPKTRRQRRQAQSTSQLKRVDSDTTNTGSCSVRNFGAMCVPPKTKKQVQNASVRNAT